MSDDLGWEARQRPRAALAAGLAAVLTLGSAILTGVLFGDAPRSWLGSSLERALEPGRLAGQESLQIPFYDFYDERSAGILGSSLARALGWIGTGYALSVLARMTQHRRPELPSALVYLPIVAGVLTAVATLTVDVASKIAVDAFLGGERTVASAQDVTASGALVLGQFIGLAGALTASIAFVFVSLNAMRVGLLTRFLGVLGIIVGVLLIFPIGSPIPIVQVFWLVALSLLFAGRWPQGNPPAWRTGAAEPWPSAVESRESRRRAMEAKRSGADEPGDEDDAGDEPAAVPAGGTPHASSRKRKRKRRD